MKNSLENRIFDVTDQTFEEVALDLFHYQAANNPIYKKYIELIKRDKSSVSKLEDIPFLPISLFKTHEVLVEGVNPEIIFSSSGTTGMATSKHLVVSVDLYERSFLNSFNLFYGDPKDYCFLALLPSYLERQDSSLVYMANKLIRLSKYSQSGFFLDNKDQLINVLAELKKENHPTILLGVTFALLDLAQKYEIDLSNTIIMETGGMKGRGQEMVRGQVHKILKNSFGVETIHSEYGMTELLSQAYSKGEGIFETPPWMRIVIRDPYDPFSLLPRNRSGAINIIDLANVYSCPFIQTDDLGVVNSNGTFEVQGRMDGSQIRGCNLMVV